MRRLRLLALAPFLLAACTTLADMSSGHVGCPPEQIVVSNERNTVGSKTWVAECNGRVHDCSMLVGGDDSTPAVSCTPRGGVGGPPGGSSAPPPASGCQFDTQCKGDRICEAGQCVTPPSPVTPAPAAEPAPTPPA